MVGNKSHLLYKSSLLFALIVLLITSWNAPISGDEYVHVKQAEKNIRYLTSFGNDKEALDTPISRLKHYGQSFDTITVYVASVLEVNDLYRFRHMANASIAWLTILFSSLVCLRITKSNYAALVSVTLFLISLRFMGHSMNNLKDIPFAFAFIFSIHFLFRFLEALPKISWFDLSMFVIGLSFGTSIRIGGLLIFAYFILFTGLYIYYQSASDRDKKMWKMAWIGKLVIISFFVFFLSYLAAIVLWPFALENPLKNPWISMQLIHDYPTTVRQIFEGKLYWSDQFPWYYLIKYIAITVPLAVLAGFGLSLFYIWKLENGKSVVFYIFLLISFGFPLFYAIVSGANVYGGWRQLLFIFPSLIIMSSIGLWLCYSSFRDILLFRISALVVTLILIYGPIKYFIQNYPYQYTFFNEMIGGTDGAFGRYEIDYYFTSFKNAYEFIDQDLQDEPKIVAANFIIPEYYKNKTYQPKLIDYYGRSNSQWDYAIICNTFLDPYQLQNDLWPPANVVHIERVEGVAVLAVLQRATHDGFEGKCALDQGNINEAIAKLNRALDLDPQNESTRLNLARAYYQNGEYSKATSTIQYLQTIYPSSEWARDLSGEIALKKNNSKLALSLFEENIRSNNRFFHSYINLATVLRSQGKDKEAISYLILCLKINPFYKPAYKLYGEILIDQGRRELGERMLQYALEVDGRYR